MNAESIVLVSFGPFERELADLASVEVRNEFRLPVRTREEYLDLSVYYDPERRQYNGTKLLKELEHSFKDGTAKTLGLLSVDLFIPILTYIFGQAYLNGCTGIVSVYRLNNEAYGIKPDRNLLAERFCKEVMHELGHMFGLIHCSNPSCVMRSSTYVEDIDQKDKHFCRRCKQQLDTWVTAQ